MTQLSRSRSRRPSERPAGYFWYLVPGAVGFIAVVLIPFGMNIWYSLTRWSGVGTAQFIGLENYARLLVDQHAVRGRSDHIAVVEFVTRPKHLVDVGPSVGHAHPPHAGRDQGPDARALTLPDLRLALASRARRRGRFGLA